MQRKKHEAKKKARNFKKFFQNRNQKMRKQKAK